jgi:hypothetical protein
MLLFLSEQRDNTPGMKLFTALAMRAGEPSALVQQPDEPEPSQYVLQHCDRDPDDIAGFEMFRYHAQAEKFRCTRYGTTDDEMRENGLRWYAHYVLTFETYIKRMGIDHLVTWGSSLLGNRAAIFAAEDLGLKVSCIEDGWFRWRTDENTSTRTFTVTPDRAYYEWPPDSWIDRYVEYTPDLERFETYRQWWLRLKQTKYSGTSRHELLIDEETPLPEEWQRDMGHIVWFGQLYGDAAQYWLCPEEAKQQIAEDAARLKAWYKPHPFTQEEHLPEGLRALPQQANIHSILPECEQALLLTSNVGLEAQMYDVPVSVYGDPFYTCLPKGPAALDYIIHKLQFPADDAGRFVEMLHEGQLCQ